MRNDNEEQFLLERHLRKLLENPLIRDCPNIWFIPENNMGLEASHLHTMVTNFTDVITTYWQKDDRPGVCKTAEITRNYMFTLNNALACGKIRFSQQLFTTCLDRDVSIQSMRNMLREQMERFHWESKAANDNFGRAKYTLTGKLGDKQDDLLIATFMVLYWGQTILNTRSLLLR